MSEQEIADKLCRLIVEIKPEAEDKAKPEARLQTDVGLTSVQIIDLVIGAEDEFGIEIPDDDTGELMDATVQELARRVEELSA